MIIEFPIVCCIIVMIYITCKRKKDSLKKAEVLLVPFKDFFQKSSLVTYSVFQSVLKLKEHPTIKYLCGVITLKQEYLMLQPSVDTKGDSVIITGELNKISPCFYIHAKSINLNHYGKKLVKKCLLNATDNYKMYGHVDKQCNEFVTKYKITYFYVSYLPVTVSNEYSFKSIICLKCPISTLKDTNFIPDFMSLFNSVRTEEEKKFVEAKRQYLKDLNDFNENERKDFATKIAEKTKQGLRSR